MLLQLEESGECQLELVGPKQEHVIKVAGESEHELELGMPGLAVVDGPGGPKAVFAEPGVKVVVKI